MRKQSNDFYNKFSFFYPLVDLFLSAQKQKLYEELAQLPSGSLLDIGVGNGKHLKYFKQHKVTGIDTSLSMLKLAEKQKPQHVELLHMNGETLLFEDQTFDYIILSHVIAVVHNPDQLLVEAYRVLKRDGKIFILNHFTPKNWLKHVDFIFQNVSKRFYFKSVFYLHQIAAVKKFTIVKEINIGPFSYFKLIILGKA